MTRILDQFVRLLAIPPGNLAISILLIIILATTLLLIVVRARSENNSVIIRRIIGIGVPLIFQGILLLINLFVYKNIIDEHWGFPLAERAFALITLIFILWLFLFPEANPRGDLALGIATVLIFFMLLILLTAGSTQPSGSIFIYSVQDIFWQAITLIILILTTTFMLIFKPVRYHFGLAIAFLAGFSHLLYLLVPMPIGYYPAIIPIYQLIVFLIISVETGYYLRGSKQPTVILPAIERSESDTIIDGIKSFVKNILSTIIPRLFHQKREVVRPISEEKDILMRSLDTLDNSERPDEIKLQLRMTLEELAILKNELGEARLKIKEFEEKEPPIPINSEEQTQMITTIAQELRQPMSSVIGYTDLIMGESVGILGALQRKFLERVKFSSEKVVSLIEDLIRITTNESERIIMNPQVIDLNNIIDNAIAYTSAQLREKNITMRLDIPESPPMIHIDREALQQILIHLLQNAGAATLVEGTIQLSVLIQTENDKDFLLIQVVDSGGGIPSKDIPRVFARRYRAENVLIQGLGDTGVGLSITKALAEAQFGRIWVETSLGIGSTISVLLPIVSAKSDDDEQDTTK